MQNIKDVAKRETSSPALASEIPAVPPEVDIYENEEEILLYADMPGVAREDMAINIENGKLFLTGRRKFETTGSAWLDEFGAVEYRRTFAVPQGLSMEKASAELQEGVLKLHLPKSEVFKMRQIEIKAN